MPISNATAIASTGQTKRIMCNVNCPAADWLALNPLLVRIELDSGLTLTHDQIDVQKVLESRKRRMAAYA